MNAEQIITINSPLDQHISQLKLLIQGIQEALTPENAPQIQEALDELELLVDSLHRLNRQIAQRDEQRQQLFALSDTAQVINSSLDLEDVLRIVMDTIVRLTGAERAFLMLRDKSGDLIIRLARNWSQESIDASEAAVSRTVVNQVITSGQPVLTTNAQQDPRFADQESVIASNLRSILCVPLKVKEDLIGVLYADNRVRSGLFTEMDRNLLAVFANQAAVAIENARLFESVRQSLAEVTELKNLMDNVFASITSGVITTDCDDRITATNRVAEAILGQIQEEMVGQEICRQPLLCGLDLPTLVARVRQTNQPIIGFTASLPDIDRGLVHLRFNLSPLRNAAGVTQGVAIVVEDLTETKQLEAQRRLFERMVSPAVIQELNPDELDLGGQRNQITTLFADLRGFTSLSEQYDAEDLVALLNRYLGAAAEAVLSEGGTVDKFMGDAIMAFFNAPIPQPDHALRAVRAALCMRTAISTFQNELPPRFRLSLGIGIHTGEAVLGLIGSKERMEYTAIGDSVNTAKRLQENAAAGQILTSAAVVQQVAGSIRARLVDPVIAKGKREPIEVYEVIDLL